MFQQTRDQFITGPKVSEMFCANLCWHHDKKHTVGTYLFHKYKINIIVIQLDLTTEYILLYNAEQVTIIEISTPAHLLQYRW